MAAVKSLAIERALPEVVWQTRAHGCADQGRRGRRSGNRNAGSERRSSGSTGAHSLRRLADEAG